MFGLSHLQSNHAVIIGVLNKSVSRNQDIWNQNDFSNENSRTVAIEIRRRVGIENSRTVAIQICRSVAIEISAHCPFVKSGD